MSAPTNGPSHGGKGAAAKQDGVEKGRLASQQSTAGPNASRCSNVRTRGIVPSHPLKYFPDPFLETVARHGLGDLGHLATRRTEDAVPGGQWFTEQIIARSPVTL